MRLTMRAVLASVLDLVIHLWTTGGINIKIAIQIKNQIWHKHKQRITSFSLASGA